MEWLMTLSFFSSAYVLVGFGFSLASWLQAAELSVDDGNGIPSYWKVTSWFILIWPLIAVYCYKAEVKKSIAKIDFDKLNDK